MVKQTPMIPRVDESGVLEMLASSPSERVLKFVLLADPLQNGYVRFGLYGVLHIGIWHAFQEQYGKKWDHRGGGFVFVKSGEDRQTLKFYGSSGMLGPFDRELLRTTLSEGLSGRFGYVISKKRD